MGFSDHSHLVVLAGGEGVRFAPLSTPALPKQFLRIFSHRSLLQETVHRFDQCIPAERLWVTTNTRYVGLVQEHLPQVPLDNISAESEKKNTAPALALAATRILERDPEGIMIVLPSDHIIRDIPTFLEAIETAQRLAIEDHLLLTLGISPNRPAVEYGYIERGEPISARAFRIERFVEKPDHDRATAYLGSGRFYWNSGMFIWRAATLLEEIDRCLPELATLLKTQPTTSASATAHFFHQAPSISIDYGVMERTDRAATVPVQCGWSDVGSWQGLRNLVDETNIPLQADIYPYLQKYA